MSKILLVDDDVQALDSMKRILEFANHEVITATDGQAALEFVRPNPSANQPRWMPEIVISDVRMPRMGGLEFLRALSVCSDSIPVILMTAFGRIEDAVWAMKLGAVDFLTKPFKRQALLNSVESALRRVRPRQTTASTGAATILGNTPAIRELRSLIHQAAPTAATVLIQGESGTGKELVARCLHDQSTRSKAKLIALNCAAVPEQLIESELFGHEKGAFTGASQPKIGLFEAAHEGTLFLDEIGDMPILLQAKLLRALQEGEIRRVGSTASVRVDVRVVAATHHDLYELVKVGKFRQDLLYRLEVITLKVPPLRERIGDIPELASHFLSLASLRHGKQVTEISKETLEILLSYSWPGNIRELANVIERSVIFARSSKLETSDLPAHLLAVLAKPGFGAIIAVPIGTSLKDVEDLMIRKTLEATSGDKNVTAKILGINERTIYRKLDKRLE